MINNSLNLSQHKLSVARVYNLASAGYDQPAVRFFSLVAKRLVEICGLKPGEHVLDAATGTAAAALVAAEKVGTSGQVVGVDMAEDMLAQAQTKIARQQLRNVVLRLGDMEHLDFPDDSFDAVICASSIFFLPEMKNGLAEWKRVTRPGGRVAFSGYGDSAFRPLSDLFEARIRKYGVSFASPSRPFSWQRITDPEQYRALMVEAGFANVQVYVEQLGYFLNGGEAWWDIVWNSGFRGPVSHLSPEALEKFKAEHLMEVETLMTPKAIWLDISAIFCLGTTP